MSKTMHFMVSVTIDDDALDPDVVREDLESGMSILSDGDGLVYELKSIEATFEPGGF